MRGRDTGRRQRATPASAAAPALKSQNRRLGSRGAGSFRGGFRHGHDRPEPEDRDIAALGNFEDNGFLEAFPREVAIEPLAQVACLRADDAVFRRIVGRCPAEDPLADEHLGQVVCRARQLAVNHVGQKLLQPVSTTEIFTGDDPLHQGPAVLRRNDGLHTRVGHVDRHPALYTLSARCIQV